MINLKKWLGLQVYVSELDRFLAKYNRTHTTNSASQQQEIDRNNIVRTKRDQESPIKTTKQSIINDLLN